MSRSDVPSSGRFTAASASRRGHARGGHLAALTTALALLVASVLAIGAMALMPTERTVHVVVVAPPWYSAAQTMGMIAAAGGRIVEPGRYENMMIAAPAPDQSARDLLAALHRSGAWLTWDAFTLRGCAAI